jgi:cellulose synthase/poly-beta-1,6-N-acetylglucosamine synthase-like glycosyltransferase
MTETRFLIIASLMVLIYSLTLIQSKPPEHQHAKATPSPEIERDLKVYKTPKHPVAVIVPCIPEDIPALKTLVANVNKQTVLPQEVVIGLSETKISEAQGLQKKLQKQAGNKYKVKVTSIGNKALAGGNRNRAVQSSQSELLFFLDADDVMSPYRIEHVLKVMDHLDNKPSVLLHGYHNQLEASIGDIMKDKVKFSFRDLEKSIIRSDKLYGIRNKRKYSHNDPLFGVPVHHGHPVVKREVFKNVYYDESMRRAQDTNFLNKCFEHYKGKDNGVYFVDLPLTYYKSRQHQKKNNLKQYA